MTTWVSNSIVVLLVAGGIWLARRLARNRFWRESAIELWRRRRLAIVVLAVFVFIALLDSISWVGGARDGDDLAAFRPQNHHRSHLSARDLQGGKLFRAACQRGASTAASRSAIRARICSAPTSSAATWSIVR